MRMNRKSHWEAIYQEKNPDEVSWYQREPEPSLELIQSVCPDKGARIIDVGGGASRLAHALLTAGFKEITVLDISAQALEYARLELAGDADQIHWVVADVLQFKPERSFNLWHDRAVFHFLTDPGDRMQYVEVLKNTVTTDGFALIASFAVGGPERCSGLPVVQYDSQKLGRELGPQFKLIKETYQIHRTPWGAEQKFYYALFMRSGPR